MSLDHRSSPVGNPRIKELRGKSAFVYQATLARNAKTEPEFLATIFVIPSSTKAYDLFDVQLVQHGLYLGMKAIRELDPEIGGMHISTVGEPSIAQYNTQDEPAPSWGRNGWAVYIEWKSMI